MHPGREVTSPGRDRPPATTQPTSHRRGSVWAAVTAVALGVFSMAAFAAGNHRWDGLVLFEVAHGHGIHLSDLMGLIPLAAGVALAAWCLRPGGAGRNG